MCCLFGIIDYHHSLTGKQKSQMLAILAAACEARGTDATGVAYNSRSQLHIYKRPVPGHKLRAHIPHEAGVIMGHTRMTTQGTELRNYNNHPFEGRIGNIRFALAHNGVLHNDIQLRKTMHLPKTKIETDSYIAVQLIEQKKALSFASLKYMAEQVEGSFTFTVLDHQDNLYIVKGDNPLCLYHYPHAGLYLYASTQDILERAIQKLRLPIGKPIRVGLDCGDMLRIDAHGQVLRDQFDARRLITWWYYNPYSYMPSYSKTVPATGAQQSYIDELKAVAGAFGYTDSQIDHLLDRGFTADEIEELLYCGEA